MKISFSRFLLLTALFWSDVISGKIIAAEPETNRVMTMNETVQFDFTDSSQFERIMLVHDTVMGGHSNGYVRQQANTLLFSGNLSLANNGGFASVEFKLLRPLASATIERLVLNVTADDRRYQLRLKTAFLPQGVAYVAEFTPKTHKHDYAFTLQDFTGRYRGRTMPNFPTLNFADVTHVGIMLADKTAGPFRIALHSLSVGTK
ncbi:CIA30 family protein [Rheinheimera maricola]|uniref:CIA30 family protein n=1 Tax=Rheinheimera maricola TaxID=2793282 RepID=A0ABS7X895_9GAMM|nr:CIA30 family protein [Rheinheimera maricola]MBZ9610963.1 CIA30 family protein [Rheinheimera maricola]